MATATLTSTVLQTKLTERIKLAQREQRHYRRAGVWQNAYYHAGWEAALEWVKNENKVSRV